MASLKRGRYRECPVLADSLHVAAMSRDMVRALRRLRRDLNACKACRQGRGDLSVGTGEAETCPILDEFHGWVNAAIMEVMEEWEGGGE